MYWAEELWGTESPLGVVGCRTSFKRVNRCVWVGVGMCFSDKRGLNYVREPHRLLIHITQPWTWMLSGFSSRRNLEIPAWPSGGEKMGQVWSESPFKLFLVDLHPSTDFEPMNSRVNVHDGGNDLFPATPPV